MVRTIDTRNFSDNRADEARARELSGAASFVSNQLPGEHTVRVFGLNSLTGTPNVLKSSNAESTSGSLIDQALKHVNQTSAALGFAISEPVEFVPDPTVQQTSAGSYAVHLQQDYHGIPVFQMARTVRFSSNREITEVAGNNANLPAGIDIAPQINIAQAVLAAAQYVATSDDSDQGTDGWGQTLSPVSINISGYNPRVLVSFPMPSRPTVVDKGPFGDLIPVHLVVFYQNPDARLGWHVLITMPDYQGQYAVIVSADRQEPEILYCQSTIYTTVGKGHIFVESPGRTPRQEVSFPRPVADYPLPVHEPASEKFPLDWCIEDRSVGNNVTATLGDSAITLQGHLEEQLVIFHPESDTGDEQKILNIFYFCNYMHDFFYILGFDEASGNFQLQNLSGDGLPGDPVLARAHSGRVNGTANMLTPVDGQSPIMNMGLVAGTRHTAFDADVVFHEFTHGVTNRLVGGRMNSSALEQPQSRGMGEGWSDFFALTIQNYGKPTERVVTGDWVVNDPRGIRLHPYDSNYPGNFGTLGKGEYNEEHNIGEIWCATLMQMNRNIGAELGSSESGHQIGWQIVVDGLKLTPANPSFLDARDAILQAINDLHTAGRLNESDRVKVRKATWLAFSKFGMGPKADCFGASLQGIIADFQLPSDL